MKKIELVSPAGNFQSFLCAISAGCDAVYIGWKKFNARLGVENFTLEELKKAIYISRKNRVKTYITLNTGIYDDELLECTKFLEDIQPDAIIIQDIGLLNLIKEKNIKIPIHISTQMNTCNSYTASFLEQHGAKRIILARELTLSDIVEIKNKTKLEIEIFIHGALCFSYSGLCLFSSFVGRRSGNRGTCAQPCRLSYDIHRTKKNLKINKNRIYPLSTKDLCLINYIPQIIDSGIDAIKIEGRAKSKEYVALTTSVYRRVIDNYYQNSKNFKVESEDEIKLAQIFNRGFTTGFTFLDENILNIQRPSNRGIFIGRVVDVDYKNNLIFFKTENRLLPDDIIEIWTKRGGRVNIEVKEIKELKDKLFSIKVKNNLINNINIKDRIFKIFDVALQKEIERYF